MKYFLTAFSLLFFSFTSFTQVYWPHGTNPYPRCNTMTGSCTKWPIVANGNWNVGTTWNNGTVPTTDDIVCIPAGTTVVVAHSTYSETTSCPAASTTAAPRLQIFVCGTIQFNNSGQLNLSCNSFIQIYAGGSILPPAAGSGSSDLIQIGPNVVWGGPGTGNQPPIYGPWVLSYPYIGAGVLPVAFGHFKAEQKQPFTVNLEWSTLQEINNSSFVIERSKDQKTWSTIGSVASAGNSTIKNVYTYIDKAPEAGNNFYRLRQVDLTGQVSFSETVRILHIIKKDISIFPNPVNAAAQLYTKEAFKPGQVIQLIDAKGTRLKTINPTGGNRVQIEMNGMAAGLYLIQLMENGRIIESVSVIKQ